MLQLFQNFKISVKLSIVCSFVLILLMSVMGIILLNNIRKTSFKTAEEIAIYEADLGRDKLIDKFDSIKNLVLYFEKVIMNGWNSKTVTRKSIIKFLNKEIKSNQYLLGVYTCWEPNSFDGNDKYWINKPGNDSKGRFVPYIVKSRGQIILVPVINLDNSDFYLIPKKTKEFSLIPPFYYNIQGENIYMISFIEPLLDKDKKFLGIVGADIKVDTVENIVKNIKPMGGYSFLVAPNDIIVAHGQNPYLTGKNIYNLGILPDTKSKLLKGQKFIEHAYSTPIKDRVIRVYEPIRITETNQVWYMVVVIPEKNILADYYRYFRIFILGITLTTIALIITINYLISRFLAPIEKIAHIMGNYNPDEEPPSIPVLTKDEIGVLSTQINKSNRLVWNYTEELKKRQMEIQELIKSRDSFIATLTHDLRSPINAEQKALEAIISKKLGSDLVNFIEYLEDIYKTNEELLRIVNNLLTVYHYESGQIKLNIESVNIGELINDSIRTLKHLAKDEQSELIVRIETGLPDIKADKDQIMRVMINLISNAVKHNTKGTQISISAKKTDNEIGISVHDNGKGILEEEKPNIFKRYPTTKRKIGTGLGLYLSKQIIDAHHGKIWFDTDEKEGTTFYFTIPIVYSNSALS